MSEIRWVPGFIRLTSRAGTTYWQSVAEIVQFNAGTRGDTHGSYIFLRGEDGAERFVTESPDQIADLIRQEWEKRISGEAAMGAEYGTGDYKIGKDGWT
jgi:alkanesulfonate monooxygenase SsuD/methylene tetrahydromethanopterin reductase-like flavin-dependent oxidoreductase (luciferase family)